MILFFTFFFILEKKLLEYYFANNKTKMSNFTIDEPPKLPPELSATRTFRQAEEKPSTKSTYYDEEYFLKKYGPTTSQQKQNQNNQEQPKNEEKVASSSSGIVYLPSPNFEALNSHRQSAFPADSATSVLFNSKNSAGVLFVNYQQDQTKEKTKSDDEEQKNNNLSPSPTYFNRNLPGGFSTRQWKHAVSEAEKREQELIESIPETDKFSFLTNNNNNSNQNNMKQVAAVDSVSPMTIASTNSMNRRRPPASQVPQEPFLSHQNQKENSILNSKSKNLDEYNDQQLQQQQQLHFSPFSKYARHMAQELANHRTTRRKEFDVERDLSQLLAYRSRLRDQESLLKDDVRAIQASLRDLETSGRHGISSSASSTTTTPKRKQSAANRLQAANDSLSELRKEMRLIEENKKRLEVELAEISNQAISVEGNSGVLDLNGVRSRKRSNDDEKRKPGESTTATTTNDKKISDQDAMLLFNVRRSGQNSFFVHTLQPTTMTSSSKTNSEQDLYSAWRKGPLSPSQRKELTERSKQLQHQNSNSRSLIDGKENGDDDDDDHDDGKKAHEEWKRKFQEQKDRLTRQQEQEEEQLRAISRGTSRAASRASSVNEVPQSRTMESRQRSISGERAVVATSSMVIHHESNPNPSRSTSQIRFPPTIRNSKPIFFTTTIHRSSTINNKNNIKNKSRTRIKEQ